MARVVSIDHLVLRVKEFERSRRFYDLVLGFLGFKRKYKFAKTAGWSNGKTLLWIGEADAEGKKHPHRIGNIGFHHYAFELGKRQDVDDLYALLQKHGDRLRCSRNPGSNYPTGLTAPKANRPQCRQRRSSLAKCFIRCRSAGKAGGELSRLWRGLLRGLFHRSRRPKA